MEADGKEGHEIDDEVMNNERKHLFWDMKFAPYLMFRLRKCFYSVHVFTTYSFFLQEEYLRLINVNNIKCIVKLIVLYEINSMWRSWG